MNKRYCDECKKEMSGLKVRYELKTIYPALYSKETPITDFCYSCMKKAKVRMTTKEAE